MQLPIISFFLLIYLSTYVISHIPFDLIMYFKKGKAVYPNPPFSNKLQGFLFVSTSLVFWIYLLFIPLIYIIYNINLITNDFFIKLLPYYLRILIQSIGSIFLLIGLIISSLGRIGRGLYAAKDESHLATNWGHAIVRHPEYFFYITGFIGLFLLTLNIFLIYLLFGIPAYIQVTDNEEEALKNHFGEEFIIYSRKVGKLFPKSKKR